MTKKQGYRITWRHEIYLLADNPSEARDKWETINLGKLKEEVAKKHILSHEFVELSSVEDMDSYKDVMSDFRDLHYNEKHKPVA